MRPAALALALALLAPPADAQETRTVGDVTITVEAPWPQVLGRGCFPIFVDLENDGDERRSIAIQAQGFDWNLQRRATRNLVLEPGQREALELYFPARPASTTGLTVRVGRDDNEFFSLSSGSSGNGLDPSLMVLTPTRDPVALAELEKDLEAWGPYGPAGSADASLGAIDPARAPRRPQAYTSLHAVLLDVERGLPDAERLAALLAWVRTGGSAVIVGRGARARLAAVPALEGAFEERFQEERLDGQGGWRHGLGRLRVVEEPLTAQAVHLAVATTLRAAGDPADPAASYVPADMWRLSGMGLEIPGLGRLPLRTFMVLLFAFALLIGPLNLMYLKRIGRPALLLLTIPGLSIAASLALLGYGIFHQGLDTKSVRHTLTFLDQRTARAATVERRMFFAGLSPRALRPGPGTSVHPEAITSGQNDRYLLSFDGGIALGGSYAPARDPVRQVVLSEAARRAHLVVERDGQRLRVANNLGAAVQALALRDAAGALHRLEGPLAAGESAVLRSADDDVAALEAVTQRSLLYGGLTLTPSTYLARLDDTPFADDCGLEMNVKRGGHVVLGVLPALERDWGGR